MRDCNKCVYSTREGGCRRWGCDGTVTVEDIRTEERKKVVEEIAEHLETCKSEAFGNGEPLIGSVLMGIKCYVEHMAGGSNVS